MFISRIINLLIAVLHWLFKLKKKIIPKAVVVLANMALAVGHAGSPMERQNERGIQAMGLQPQSPGGRALQLCWGRCWGGTLRRSSHLVGSWVLSQGGSSESKVESQIPGPGNRSWWNLADNSGPSLSRWGEGTGYSPSMDWGITGPTEWS